MTALQILGISFETPLLALLAIPAAAVFLLLNRGVGGRSNRAVMVLRALAIVMLLAVLASPYMVREEEIKQESTSILAIDDQTDSMSLSGSSGLADILERVSDRTGGLAKGELVNITTPDRTAVGDAIYQGILGSSMKSNVVILSSDGRNNWGADPLDVVAFAGRAKTRIFPLLSNTTGREVYISDISGADKTPLNSKYEGKVALGSVGEGRYKLAVSVDGISLIDTSVEQNAPLKEIPFEYTFRIKGPHNIIARITPESGDEFGQNNVFNKVVNVVDRPNVLFVTSSNASSLKLVLDEIYDVKTVDRVPSNLGAYSAVVIDDEPAASVGDMEALRGFLNDGGGLVVVGGNHSYNGGGYYGSELEGLLPVRSTEAPPRTGEKTSVVILLDISGSTGIAMGGDTKIDIEKAIAVKMIRDLGKSADIGVAAFNADSFAIQSIKKTADTSDLEGKISRLQFGGGTYVATGLIRAGDMLRSVQGAKYIVLISDGVTNYGAQAFDKAASLASQGVIIHTIGVGLDTDESFMRGLAIRGNGIYFKPTETERVKIVLGNLEEEDGRKGFGMIITDAHHFITEGLAAANVSVKSFNDVTAKSSAQVLAATQGMKPLLAVWRFGLGRVASLMVDNGNQWAVQLYTEGNSKLISAMVNWAAGDPERHREVRIDCQDARVGRESAIAVFSKSDYPKVSVGGEEVQLTKLDDEDYYFKYLPASPGFMTVSSAGYECAMAVNYPEEYGAFGNDLGLLSAMANITGGRVYYPEDSWQLIEDVAKYTVSESTGVAIRRTNMQLWFALAALLLFLADIIIRRMREITQSRAEGGRKKGLSPKLDKIRHATSPEELPVRHHAGRDAQGSGKH